MRVVSIFSSTSLLEQANTHISKNQNSLWTVPLKLYYLHVFFDSLNSSQPFFSPPEKPSRWILSFAKPLFFKLNWTFSLCSGRINTVIHCLSESKLTAVLAAGYTVLLLLKESRSWDKSTQLSQQGQRGSDTAYWGFFLSFSCPCLHCSQLMAWECLPPDLL